MLWKMAFQGLVGANGVELVLPEPVQAVVAAAGPTSRSEVELQKVFQTSEGPLYRILAAIKEAVGGDSRLLVTTLVRHWRLSGWNTWWR